MLTASSSRIARRRALPAMQHIARPFSATCRRDDKSGMDRKLPPTSPDSIHPPTGPHSRAGSEAKGDAVVELKGPSKVGQQEGQSGRPTEGASKRAKAGDGSDGVKRV